MKTIYYPFFVLTICLISISLSHSQTIDRITQINRYCDSLNKLTGIQTIRKVGAGVQLEYFISNGSVVKIIEQPIGYKYVSAIETYYLQNDKSVYVQADIEISNEEGDQLTIELHKIYFNDNQIIDQLTSEQTFNSDSLYKNSSDPIKTANNIRKNARFKPRKVDHNFERTLIQTIDNYLNARSKTDGDPVFNNLYSPFI